MGANNPTRTGDTVSLIHVEAKSDLVRKIVHPVMVTQHVTIFKKFVKQTCNGLCWTLTKAATRTCMERNCSMVFTSKRYPVLLNLVEINVSF